MAKVVGGLLRSLATIFYILDFLTAAVVLVIFSYYLAKLSYHDMGISNDWRAVEGLSGTAVLYSIFAVLLTCFLGGVKFFALLAIIFDILFCGAMIACAVLLRQASHGCKNNTVSTPLGTGLKTTEAAGTNLGTACKLDVAAFACSIAAAVFFAISALLQIAVMGHHQKEKKYGPSPANDYTSGSGKRKFYQRKPKEPVMEKEAPIVAPAAGLAVADRNMRPSHETGYTETTMVPNNDNYVNNKYEPPVTKYEPTPIVPVVAHQGPNLGPAAQTGIVSSTTTTRPGYYDPYYNPTQQTGAATNY